MEGIRNKMLNIWLTLIVIIFIVYILRLVAKKLVEMKNVISWLILCLLSLPVIWFPNLIGTISEFLGIQTLSNFVFLLITFFEKLIKILTGQKVTDPTSGLRVADRKVIEEFAKQYPSDYPEPETIVSLLTSGYSVAEVPVLMNEREHGESSITLSKSVYYMIKVTMAMLVARIGGGYKK